MKKIIVSCAILLVLSLLVVSFAGCGGNKNEQGEGEVVKGYSAVLGSQSVVVSKDGEEFQTILYPVNPGFAFDLSYANSHYEFLDMNFDGVLDFYIAASTEGNIINFFCWLFNESTNSFEYSIALSSLKNISVDAEDHSIYSIVYYDGAEKVLHYKWVDASLKLQAQYDTTNETLPSEITDSMEENKLVNNKKEEVESSSDNTVADSAVNKPQNNDAQSGSSSQNGNNEPQSSSDADKPQNNNSDESKPASNNDKTTSSNDKTTSSNDKTTSSNDKPASSDKPANVTTTVPSTVGGVVLGTGDIDNGWF